MYRIFVESYKNYITQNSEGYRKEVVSPISLIVDVNEFNKQKKENTLLYKKLCDLLCYMKNNIDVYPRFEAFLWTLEAREMNGCYYGVMSEQDLDELSKIINMFLKLVYWQSVI